MPRIIHLRFSRRISCLLLFALIAFNSAGAEEAGNSVVELSPPEALAGVFTQAFLDLFKQGMEPTWETGRQTDETFIKSKEFEKVKSRDKVLEQMNLWFELHSKDIPSYIDNSIPRLRQAIATSLSHRFSPDQINQLLQFARSDIGMHYHTTAHPHPDKDPEHKQFSEDDRLRLKAFSDGNLFYPYYEVLGIEMAKFVAEFEQFAVHFDAEFEKGRSQIIDQLYPEHVFSEPLQNAPDETFINLFAEAAPATHAYIERERLIDQSLNLDFSDASPRIGDSITALVSYGDEKLERQWIIQLEVLPIEELDSGLVSKTATAVYHTMIGNRHEFASNHIPCRITIVGPFSVKAKPSAKEPAVHTAIIALKSDYLQIGLHQFSEMQCRIRNRAELEESQLSWTYGFNHEPYSEQTIAESRESTAIFNISEEEDRAYAGSLLPLWEFLQICNQTPGLRSILMKVVKLPTPMSMLVNGFETRYNFEYGSWDRYHRLPGIGPSATSMLYSYPVTLNIYEKPSLKLRFFAMKPHPPLNLSSGFFGLVASSPDKPEKRIVIRVIHGQRGTQPCDDPTPAEMPSSRERQPS